MKRWLLVVMGLVAGVASAWAQPVPRLGVGGSFNVTLGTPMVDFFYEIPSGENAAIRFGAGILAVVQGAAAVSLDASYLLMPKVEGLQPYFGGGVGALVALGAGVAEGNLTVNGLAGVYWPLAPTFGLYGQVRLLGVVDLATLGFVALVMPGVGLFVVF